MLLQGGDRYAALVRIEETRSGFLGLHLARALHQDACNDMISMKFKGTIRIAPPAAPVLSGLAQ